MSTLSQFGGSPIKSIQRGTMSTTATTVSATISAVNTSKAMVNFLGQRSDRSSSTTAGNGAILHTLVLASSTSVTAQLGLNASQTYTVSYEVIEFI